MKKALLVISVMLFIAAISFVYGNRNEKDIDYVPDKATAIKVAEAIWHPIYGDMINDAKPFVARLKNPGVWIVEGTLHYEAGGVAYIEIQKKDCRILKVTHGK